MTGACGGSAGMNRFGNNPAGLCVATF